MSFYCRACSRRFTLPWTDGETPESYAERLATTYQATCPQCGRECRRCKCKKQQRTETA